ncbi:hypothetical protein E5A73_10050 [Sphingomonas gei]|uniref:SPOR domain-containing protein n=1 Tax=Sphingomonas gei TaxID=1395960 RepID=A0A4S1XCQ5_9SPHN|nr:hypothetical protein [Sphingomonas gei]TGX53200.1 hypothetical protein E5A73_10050 [Sphingomonas gei]
MILPLSPLAFAAAFVAVLPAHAQTTPRADDVLVLGALHDLHAREESFGYDRLHRLLEAFRPDVVVLEVRPDELAGRTDTPGRPEYPRMVWRWLDESRVEAVAMEPGGARFAELAGAAAAAFAALGRNDPQGAAALTAFDEALETALLAYWRHPSQTQDATTARMVDSHVALRAAIVGPAFAKVQSAWDDGMAEVATRTVQSRPGKRVLVIGSYRNRGQLEDAVRKVAAARIVPSSAWVTRVAGADD